MIDDFLVGEDWDEPHPDMEFEAPLGAIIEEVERLSSILGAASHRRTELPAETPHDELTKAARGILIRAPALVNVLLNYKICAEHGLPFHPTVYYELAEAKRYRLSHPIAEIERANRLFRESIGLARAAYRLAPDFGKRAASLASRLPPELSSFVYSGGKDKYTWRASEPAKLQDLAAKVAAAFEPALIVAAAHGSIMPGLLLAEYLDIPLYFIRFSMFKRSDEAPILSIADEAWLAEYSAGKALLFDEDVAKGRTLSIFAGRLSPLFMESKTACAIRHAGAGIKPDFAARTWWD